MEQRISIITLGVKNLEASTDFYINKFGWSKSEQSTDGISFFHLNGILLGLYPISEFKKEIDGLELASEGRNRKTMAFLTRSEKEVDELFKNFESNKIEILKQPEKAFWGGYSGYIADLDGNLWEIAYNPYIELDDEGNLKS